MTAATAANLAQALQLASPIAREITALPQWVGARPEHRPGQPKPTKVPVNVHTGQLASTTDPSSWATFEDVSVAVMLGHVPWRGFVFTAQDPFVGIDLDGCRHPQTGAVADWAQRIVDAFPAAYVELSISGTGFHLITKGAVPFTGKRKGPVEVYAERRFFVMSGQGVYRD